MTFLGFVALYDPPRKEAGPAVRALRGAGVRTIMITGDHADTALAIARSLGIAKDASEVMTGKDFSALPFDIQAEVVERVSVFARVSPSDKVDIVKALKTNGHVVAMTGDGVNDAPALKAADVGIAMGKNGTDVARQSADMVLADDTFATIEKAVREGRAIYANVRKSVHFLLASNLAEILAMSLLILVGLPSPFLAIHLLWINLLTDSLPSIALGMSKPSDDVMKEAPRKKNASLF
ncbi:MAG: HAD-IC family P-type ATPase, partial [Candidatus Enteromonas sp.]